ncbi:hypothetical protein D3C75_765790 [compost metagenome]
MTQASRPTSLNCAEIAGSETATMVWSSAPRKMASIRAVSTLRRAVGGRAAVTGIPCFVYGGPFAGKPALTEVPGL